MIFILPPNSEHPLPSNLNSISMLSRSSAPILEEEIFPACNLDPDCDTIGRLLYDHGQKFILSALSDGEYAIAAGNYLQMLESLTRHFIADEHWRWFDDLYSPDYTVSRIWVEFVPHIRSGALAGECLEELEAG